MTFTAKHRGSRRYDVTQVATNAARGLIIAASSGVALTVAATTASAAPATGTTPSGRPQAGQATISEAARQALAVAPAVKVAADAIWSVDEIVAAVGEQAAEIQAAAIETSRDTERAALEAAVTPLNQVSHVTSTLNVRSAPGTENARIGSLSGNTTFTVTGSVDGWYRISYDGGEGWVAASYVKNGEAPEVTAAPAVEAPGTGEGSAWGQAVVAYARQFIGTPYQYGGKGPGGFDCSGFTSYVYGQFGISLSSSSGGQYGAGRQVSAAEAQPGDLVWWPGHVGIYTGNGMHIAARNPGMNLAETPLYRSGAVYFRLNG